MNCSHYKHPNNTYLHDSKQRVNINTANCRNGLFAKLLPSEGNHASGFPFLFYLLTTAFRKRTLEPGNKKAQDPCPGLWCYDRKLIAAIINNAKNKTSIIFTNAFRSCSSTETQPLTTPAETQNFGDSMLLGFEGLIYSIRYKFKNSCDLLKLETSWQQTGVPLLVSVRRSWDFLMSLTHSLSLIITGDLPFPSLIREIFNTWKPLQVKPAFIPGNNPAFKPQLISTFKKNLHGTESN